MVSRSPKIVLGLEHFFFMRVMHAPTFFFSYDGWSHCFYMPLVLVPLEFYLIRSNIYAIRMSNLVESVFRKYLNTNAFFNNIND